MTLILPQLYPPLPYGIEIHPFALNDKKAKEILKIVQLIFCQNKSGTGT